MEVIERFIASAGNYLGRGENHEGESFLGELDIQPAVEGAGAFLHFEAQGDDAMPLHEEQMLIGRTRDGDLYLWGLDSTTQRIRKHALLRSTVGGEDPSETVVFGSGDPDDESTYRERLTFVFTGRDVSLTYAWAQPGDAIQTRSSVELVPESFFSLSEASESTDVEYREFDALPADDIVDGVELAYERIFGEGDPLELGEAGIWTEARHPHLDVALLDGRVVAFKLGYERKPGAFYSWLGGVLPEVRRRGLGSELMTRQHRWARSRGYERIRTRTTNQWKAMIALNLQFGFDIIGTFHEEDGRTKIIMEKPLVPADADAPG